LQCTRCQSKNASKKSPKQFVLILVTNESINMSVSTASQLATLQAQVTSLTSNNNNYWLIWAGSLAILMQVGFMCLEVGSVRIKNTKNILLKVRT